MDRFILGYLDDKLPVRENVDRTVVRIPGTDRVVLVYNRFQEEEMKARINKSAEKVRWKPLAVIPEENLEIYSRCIVCRVNEDGSFTDLEPEDVETVFQYLSR